MDARKAKLDQLRTVDECKLVNALHMVATDMHAQVILRAKGTMEEREDTVRTITHVRRRLQAAVIEGGVDMFRNECKQFERLPFWPDFSHRLDMVLTKMPRRRSRRDEQDEARSLLFR